MGLENRLAARYSSRSTEQDKYDKWVEKGHFTAGDLTKKPYSVVIPPPNVTGKLHLGHAWDITLQDILCRYKRLQGYDVLWLPGMDHAGIATQAKVDARLKEEGISRYDIGREKFLDRAWEWKEEYASTIREQWKTMGVSLDYSRERFTMDEGLSQAVNKVFQDLYDQGLIYQGERIINWDPQARTALSNIEVEHKEVLGHMYYFKYKVVENGQELVIATTRPETMFADQAIFVHPEDERYKDFIGLHAVNPANGEALPIMADDYIDMEFGTAVMKCTPAHDPNDFALAKKYGLDMPVCMNDDGTMNELAHKYAGMDRFACRQALVQDFEAAGVVDHIEEHPHQVGHSERTGVIVEPFLSKQWFVKMKPLAAAVLKAQEDEDTKIHFVPARFENTFAQWLENIEDWCISRQLWWGHRIPAWTNQKTGEVVVQQERPEGDWVQDEDVLDTWFSSALWPFSTMGWPDTENADFLRYYPTNVLVTGYDIIFFWVARMAFQARHFTDSRPFEDVLIHGLIRDKQGRKMSKSLGNGVDPMDVVADKGADALRFFLTTNSAPGMDLRYDESKVDAAWNFINKFWNAGRFVLLNLEEGKDYQIDASDLSAADRWIMAKFDALLGEVERNMEKYEFSLAGNAIYDFLWNDFCSWYIELTKASRSGSTDAVLLDIYKKALILLSPYMPFVTEEIYTKLPGALESINLEAWPKAYGIGRDAASELDLVTGLVQAVRELKGEYGLKPMAQLAVHVEGTNLSGEAADILYGLTRARLSDRLSGELLRRTVDHVVLEVQADDLVDREAEKARLEKETARLKKEVARAEGMLANERFLAKAPEKKVQEERKKLAKYQEQLELTLAQLEAYQ